MIFYLPIKSKFYSYSFDFHIRLVSSVRFHTYWWQWSCLWEDCWPITFESVEYYRRRMWGSSSIVAVSVWRLFSFWWWLMQQRKKMGWRRLSRWRLGLPAVVSPFPVSTWTIWTSHPDTPVSWWECRMESVL